MACTDVQTIQAGNGTKTQFSFDFPYIFKSEIHVYFWNVVTKEYDEKLTTDATYPWQITDANPTIVEFTGTAPPSPSAPTDPNEPTVDNVKIRRITKVDDIRALFNPGSAIRSDDLNKNFEQLRYAVQESNCQGIPDDVDQYLKDYYWDRYDNTLYDGDTWVSDDTKIATTAALDARFQDEVNDTFTKAELSSASNIMPNNDVAVPTTGALNDYINEVITNDIGTDGTGITVTDDGDGTITLGLADDTIDFDKIKDADQIKLADQVADYDNSGSDDKVFTSLAAIRRFENYVQTSTPTPTAGIGKGAVWLDNDQDLTLSVWSGSSWIGVASGGTFTNQPKVVYVDATSGLDTNDGHRISRPKQTIKAAINQINNDATYGDGSVVIVAPGVYQEAAPIQIQKKNVSIIGQALRSCIVHPTVATQGDQSSGNHALFELNSGSFIQNLTLTGMKAGSGTGNSVDAVLPTAQGWNFAFYNGATITKSPYIQNCTNFSDSEIDNSNLNANTPAGGLAGDLDSAPTGGGMLIDGSVVDSASPLRSMVADSYTHVGLNGPGILVTNNGYTQCTSSYAFFNKYHIKALNGGQANLAASTTDFGEKSLVADGKSTTAIFTANTTAAAADGAISFTIDAPVADASWFGTAERPASNMLVTLNSVTYPVLSATANGSGWDVVISRPNPTNKSQNLGLNGAVTSGSTASFFLRSLIASSGHTMEYVGSGTDYRALPENGGVPDDTAQINELNDGKIWTATTDHNGKFVVGPFEVDQRTGNVSVAAGASVSNVVNDTSPQLGGNLDANNFDIILDSGTAANPSLRFEGDSNTGLFTPGADAVAVSTGGSERVLVNSSGNVGIGTSSPSQKLEVNGLLRLNRQPNNDSVIYFGDSANGNNYVYGSSSNDHLTFGTAGSEKMRIDSSGNVGIGTSSATNKLTVVDSSSTGIRSQSTTTQATDTNKALHVSNGNATDTFNVSYKGQGYFAGNVGIGTNSPGGPLEVQTASGERIIFNSAGGSQQPRIQLVRDSGVDYSIQNSLGIFEILKGGDDIYRYASDTHQWHTAGSGERMRIDSSGNVGISTSSPIAKLTTLGINSGGEGGNLCLQNTGSGVNTNVALYLTPNNGGGNDLQRSASIKSRQDQAGNYANLEFYTSQSATPAERMRITSSGNVLIRRTANTDTATLCVDQDASGGNVGISTITTSTGTRYHNLFRNGNGQVGAISTNGSATTYATSSDYRLKENVVDLDGAIGRVKQLAPRRFNFITDADTTVDGFLAHEAQAVVPEAVTGTHNEVDDDGNAVMQGIDQSKLVPLLTAALQEAIAKIETLEQRLTDAGL